MLVVSARMPVIRTKILEGFVRVSERETGVDGVRVGVESDEALVID